MSRENVLLIGGPRDGEWTQVEEGLREIRLAQMPKTPVYWQPDVDPQEITIVESQYRRVPFRSDRGFVGAVFVFGDIDPMVALIEGYRKP